VAFLYDFTALLTRAPGKQKEKEFFARIRRYRVDPSSQSFSNPVPDYYGEKIGSVQQYRQWLRDQRAYNKKRQNFL
jgi:import inner membrane translocase subunit TIM23